MIGVNLKLLTNQGHFDNQEKVKLCQLSYQWEQVSTTPSLFALTGTYIKDPCLYVFNV